MVQFTKKKLKDLGLQEEVFEALPYAVVGDAWYGSLSQSWGMFYVSSHVVPAGQQLKLLFLRVWSQHANGAKFRIYQWNPTVAGQMSAGVEPHPVVGSVPSGVRDYPMLEAAGAEVLRGSLVDPIHVFEGSINFSLIHTPDPPDGSRYGLIWWGVEKTPEE